MNHYTSQIIVQSHHADLMREANNARLAKLAREHQRAIAKPGVPMRIALKQIAAAATALLR